MEFVKNGYKTDLSRREFVKLDKSGVYMQIMRQGCGDGLKDGDELTLDCRYSEYDILNDTTTTQNMTVKMSTIRHFAHLFSLIKDTYLTTTFLPPMI